MPPIALLLLFVVTIALMEGFAYVMHRWVMHGPGWFLHASHHRPRTGFFEANDLYFVIFAMPSILLLLAAGSDGCHTTVTRQLRPEVYGWVEKLGGRQKEAARHLLRDLRRDQVARHAPRSSPAQLPHPQPRARG